MTKKYEIYFLRHGRTYFNYLQRMQGWSDTPLAPEGIAVTQEVANALENKKFDKVFSSDSSRARQTAEIIVNQNKYSDKIDKYLPEFRELFFGSFEGQDVKATWEKVGSPHGYATYKELIQNENPNDVKNWIKAADPAHIAEDAETYWNRVNKGLKYINSVAKDGDKILVITHGNTILSIANKFGDGSFDTDNTPKNVSLTHLVSIDNECVVDAYNRPIVSLSVPI